MDNLTRVGDAKGYAYQHQNSTAMELNTVHLGPMNRNFANGSQGKSGSKDAHILSDHVFNIGS